MRNQQHRLELFVGWRVCLTRLHQVFTLEQEESAARVRGWRRARELMTMDMDKSAAHLKVNIYVPQRRDEDKVVG